jgi:small nuclear ribonucleoprotein E
MSSILLDPTDVIHRFMTSKQKVSVWLNHDSHVRIEGVLAGYDKFMNLVLLDAQEVNTKSKQSETLGRILLKGDNVCVIHAVGV